MNKILEFFNLLYGEEDKQKVLQNVQSNTSFRGSNLWILACAIVIASVGLNVNSTAVIIGAMLISPLMGPIVASGFALGMYDFALLKRALKNLLIATVASLLVSTIYFYFSPFKEVQSELLARTSPNIYDILIAFFGGLVGVIAVTRTEKGNPIPGVAIATALMPPLCTAGYGLATGNIEFFFGAFFLYCINCIFICIATLIIVKYLQYPAKTAINEKRQRQVKYSISAIVILMLLPASFFAYRLFKKQQFTHAVDVFIEKEFAEKGYTVIYKKTSYASNPKKIELACLSKQFTTIEVTALNKQLANYNISNAQLVIRQNDNLSRLKNDILNEVSKSESEAGEKEIRIKQLEQQVAANTFNTKQIFKEATAFLPAIDAVSIARSNTYFSNDSTATGIVLLYQAKRKLSNKEEEQLQTWLQQKLSQKSVVIYQPY